MVIWPVLMSWYRRDFYNSVGFMLRGPSNMRKFLLGLPCFLFLAQMAFGAGCPDTTLVLKLGAPGFNSATHEYNPDAPGAVNNVIINCNDTTMTVRINLDASVRASALKDSVILSAPINISGRTDKFTVLTSLNKTSDSMVFFVEKVGGPTTLLTVTALNRAQIDHFGFVRKSIGSASHSVTVNAKGTMVENCHFWTADNTSGALGSLVDIQADSVLVERSLFRAPPDGAGNSFAITTHGTATAQKVEIRSNVFFSTGLYLTVGSFHIFANTFAGSRNGPRFISVGSLVVNPGTAVNIQYNMFVARVDDLAPISFGTPIVSSDSILRNAYARTKGTSLAENASGVALTLNGATGAFVNTLLPRGFSNYGPNVEKRFRDYPLTELRADSTLAFKHPNFGTYSYPFSNNWTSATYVFAGLPPSALYFTNPSLQPFREGASWTNATKAGAFVAADAVQSPSPLDSGGLGSSLTFVKDTANVGQIKVSKMSFDAKYYGVSIAPQYLYFFFSDTLAKLTSSNDTTILKSSGVPYLKMNNLGFLLNGTPLPIPKLVRNGKDIYIKLLQFKDTLQAPVLSSSGVIGSISLVPAFPFNDLKITIDAGLSDYPAGKVQLTVTKGSEPIDSIRVVSDNGAGGLVSITKAPAGSATTFVFTGLQKGTYTFYATPFGGGKPGAPTPSTISLNLGPTAGDTIFVTPKTSCPGADGTTALKAYCVLDSAFKLIAAKKTGGIIMIQNASPAINMDAITFPAGTADDTSLVTITTPVVSGKLESNRPVFKGSTTKEAMVIARKNVLVRGFVFDMPAGTASIPAVSIKSGGVQLDANVFRSASNTQTAEGPAVKIEVGATAKMRMTNNAVWGFNQAVLVSNTQSSEIKILNNTFLADTRFPNAATSVGISQQGGALNAVIANNFFSNIGSPLDATVAGMKPVLDHNVFTTGQPKLQGQTDAGALDSNDQAGSMDLTVAAYLNNLESGLNEAFACNSIHPCPSLQAASTQSANGQVYGVNLLTDLFGKPRPTVNKDVGAMEVNLDLSKVMGRLKITAKGVLNDFSKSSIEVSSKNYDSLESDSIHVWWDTLPKAQLKDMPKGQQHSYSMKKLSGGAFSDSALNLKERTFYYFYVAYSRFRAGSRLLGYAYTDTLTTGIAVETGSCSFALSKMVCPSDNGVFLNLNSSAVGVFTTRISMSEPITASGVVVKNPEFIPIDEPKVFNLSLLSPMHKIILDIAGTTLGQAGSNLSFQAKIKLPAKMDLTGKELFLLPTDPTSRPTHVSTWRLEQIVDTNYLVIEGNKGGTLTYAFGKLADDVEPGTIQVTDADPPTFDFQTAGDSIVPITVNFKGVDFKTSNPLVMASVVPAGGTATGVFSGSYPVKTVLLSSGLIGMQPDTLKDRYYKYFQNALGVQSQSGPGYLQKRPFNLDTVSALGFNSAVTYSNTNLVISNTGVLSQATIQIPMVKAYKDADAGRKASRSIEVVFTIFDGSKLVRTSSFIRSHFVDANLQGPDKKLFSANRWNLYGYPWDDADTGSQARIVGKTKWSESEMRLMKYKGTGKGAGSFNVYDGTTASSVKYDSGQAVWAGSTRNYDAISGAGISLDYQNFDLSLPVGQYTDFALPFNFPIKMSDVLATSSLPAMPTIYRYTAGRPGSWEAIKDTSILQPWDGLTIKPTSALTLKFPVLDATRSGVSPSAKQTAEVENQWSANLRIYNETAAMSLLIGKSVRGGLYGEPPDVPGQDFRMVLKYFRQDGAEESMAEFLQNDVSAWQGHWPLKASAVKGSSGVYLKVMANSKSIPLYLVESLHKTVVPLTGDSLRISEAELSANDYHLVAGDPQYLASILAGLAPANVLNLYNYPNPFSASTQVHYALPTSFGKVAFLLKIRDFRGRMVFEKTVTGSSSLNFIWDGKDRMHSPLPAGVYTLALEAKVDGKPTYRATRRLLKL